MKLTPKQVLKIFRDPRPYKVVASEYGVSEATIHGIKRGESRSDITGKRHRPKKRKRLTAEQAQAVFADPRPQEVIAAEYGFDQTAIYQVKAGKSYRWATGWPHARAARNRVGRPPKLKPEHRAAILQDQRPHREIAAEYGVSRDSVWKLKKKAGQAAPL